MAAGAVVLKGSAAEIAFVNSVASATTNLTSLWVSGHPGVSYDTVDVVAMGDAGHRNRQGLETADLSFSFLYSSGAVESYSVMASLYASTSARNIVYSPDGTSSGSPKWLIPARLFEMSFDGSPGDVQTVNVTFQIDGTSTLTAY